MGFGNIVASLQHLSPARARHEAGERRAPVAIDLLRPFIFVLRIYWKMKCLFASTYRKPGGSPASANTHAREEVAQLLLE